MGLNNITPCATLGWHVEKTSHLPDIVHQPPVSDFSARLRNWGVDDASHFWDSMGAMKTALFLIFAMLAGSGGFAVVKSFQHGQARQAKADQLNREAAESRLAAAREAAHINALKITREAFDKRPGESASNQNRQLDRER